MPIKVARVDMAKKYDFISKEGVETTNLPIIYIFYDGRYHHYDLSLTEPKLIIHLMNRYLHPLVQLKDKQEIE